MEADSKDDFCTAIENLSLLIKNDALLYPPANHQFFYYLQQVTSEKMRAKPGFSETGRWDGFAHLKAGHEGLCTLNEIYERNVWNEEILPTEEEDLKNALLGVFRLEAYYKFIKEAKETPDKLLGGKVTPIFMRLALNWVANKYVPEHYNAVLNGLSHVRTALSEVYPVLPVVPPREGFARVVER